MSDLSDEGEFNEEPCVRPLGLPVMTSSTNWRHMELKVDCIQYRHVADSVL